ncbi:MAG: VOC family protein [Parvibaculum sp.]|nr:VOC family protein [Parvibaculum sp.]
MTASKVEIYLCAKGAAEAIEFYKRAFGARETGARILDPQNRIGHAEFMIGESLMMISDEHPEIGVVSPATLGGTPVAFTIHVDNADTAYAQAIAAGAKALQPLTDQFYGERSGQLTDPFGYRWTVSQHIEDVSPDEMVKRAKALYG